MDMVSLRGLIIFGFILGVGYVFERVAVPESAGNGGNLFPMSADFKTIMDDKARLILHRTKALMPVQLGTSVPVVIPQGLKAKLYLDTNSTPPLIRYTANGKKRDFLA